MTISNELRAEAWDDESDLPLVLLTIEHPLIDPPIRVVNNTVSIISNGEEYIAFRFKMQLPSSTDAAPPMGRLEISNVSLEIGETIRTIQSAAIMSIQVVRQASPDVVEMLLEDFRLTNIRYNALTVTGNIEREDLTRISYPFLTYSPAEFAIAR